MGRPQGAQILALSAAPPRANRERVEQAKPTIHALATERVLWADAARYRAKASGRNRVVQCAEA